MLFRASLVLVPVSIASGFKFQGGPLVALVSSLQSPVSSLQSPVSSLQSPVSSLQSPVSSLQSPVSSLQSPVSSLRPPGALAHESYSVLGLLQNTK
jgi:hypothetical protein